MRIPVVVFVFCGFFAGQVSAMENEQGSSEKGASASRQEIPFAIKIDTLIGLYSNAFRTELVPLLPASDSAILDVMAQNEMAHQESEAADYLEGLAELCGISNIASSIELARRETKLADTILEKRTARYRKTFERLTSTGRSAIYAFVEESVTPKLRYSEPDSMRLAVTDEVEYRHAFELLCASALNNHIPKPLLDAAPKQNGTDDISISLTEN